jgi:hypothetical protein
LEKRDNKPALREGWNRNKKKPTSKIKTTRTSKPRTVSITPQATLGEGETDDVEMKAVRKKGKKRAGDDKVQSMT